MKKRFRIIKNVMIDRRNAPDSRFQNLGVVLLFIFLVPYITAFFFGASGEADATEQNLEEGATKVSATAVSGEFSWESYTVCNTTKAGVEKMPMEAYVAKRLACVVPADYEAETLKAQAIVIRTELLKSYEENPTDEKENKYIYVESETARIDDESFLKYKEAAEETKGMYLCYEGKAIYAPYFPISAGVTRNGTEVLGDGQYPYLQSVECNRDFTSKQYISSVRLDKGVFVQKLLQLFPSLQIGESFSVSQLTSQKDSAGYVLFIEVGGEKISGEVFRTAFSLNSSCFTMEETGNEIKIQTKGVGHGLGFGQFAANEAAKGGKDYVELLYSFFADIIIEKIE